MKTNLVFAVFAVNVLFVNGTVNICLNYNKDLKGESFRNDVEPSDSMTIPHYELNFTHPAISADIVFDNLVISNLSRMDLGFLRNGALMNFTFPNISFQGDYEMLGDIGELFDIFGKGPFWLNMLNFSVAVFPEIYINASSFCVPIRIDVLLQGAELHLSNFMEDEETGQLMNRGLSTMIPNIIKHIWDEIREGNDSRIEQFFNRIINGDATMRKLVEEEIEKRFTGIYNN